MNPIVVLQAISFGLGAIESLSKLVFSLKKSISEEIPDDQLRLESFDETVARLKAEGRVPGDHVI